MNTSWLKKFTPDPNQFLTAIISAGIFLRLSGLTASAIWYDEAITFESAKLPFFTMIEASKFSFSPPLWSIIVWVSVRVFGQNELGLRLPALAFSFFSIWIIYKICSEFYLSKTERAIVLLFFCLLPYQVAMAQDGRMYTLLTAVYFCALWFALQNRWLGLTACTGLLFYIHYTAIFYILPIYLIAIMNQPFSWKNISKSISSIVIAFMFFLPWSSVFLTTLKLNAPSISLKLADFLYILYRISFEETLGYKSLELFFLAVITSTVLLTILIFIFNISKRVIEYSTNQSGSRTKDAFATTSFVQYLQITIFALMPIILMIVWGLIWKEFIYYRLLSALVPSLIIWVVKTMNLDGKFLLLKNSILISWVGLTVISLFFWSPQTKTGGLKETSMFINNQWQNGDILYHLTGTSYLPFSQYLPNKPEYLIDEIQHPWLMPTEMQDIFGIIRKPLEDINFNRAWIFVSEEGLSSDNAKLRAKKYIKDADLIGIIDAWRFSTIRVYLLKTRIVR